MIDIEKKYQGKSSIGLHAIGFLRKLLNNQFLVILPPSFHFDVGMNNRANVFGDIFLLPRLVVKGDAARYRRFKPSQKLVERGRIM